MDKNKKNLIASFVLIIILISIAVFFYLKQRKPIEVNVEPVTQESEVLEKGISESGSKGRYNLVLAEVKKREELIVLENNSDNKRNLNLIQKLKDENIKVDIKEFVNELKKKDLLTDEDQFYEEENKIFIGRIENNKYAYEIAIKSTEDVLKEALIKEENDKFRPLSEYKSTMDEVDKIVDNKEETDDTDNIEDVNDNTDSLQENASEKDKKLKRNEQIINLFVNRFRQSLTKNESV